MQHLQCSDVIEGLTESIALYPCFWPTMVSQTTVMTELSTKDMKRFLWRVIRWQLRLLQDNRNCQDCQDHQDRQKHKDHQDHQDQQVCQDQANHILSCSEPELWNLLEVEEDRQGDQQ